MKVSDQVSKIFFHHGLFCSTRPLPTILTVICIFIFFCYPLRKISISHDAPFEAIPLPESKCKSLLSTSSLQKISDDFNFTFVAQIIFRSAISPQHSAITYTDGLRCNLNASFRIHDIVQSTAFSANSKLNCSSMPCEQKLDSICMRMKDLLTSLNAGAINLATTKSPTSRILSLPTPSLPYTSCAVLSPSLIWGNEWSLFHLDDIDLLERLNLNEVQELLDVLFGLPRRHLGMFKMQFRNLPVVNAFATTIVLRGFYPEYIHRLRERLMETFPDSRFVGKDIEGITQGYYSDPHGKDSEPRVFVVHYRGHNYLVQYAPAFAVYTFLVLYIWFSVSKIDMVKSKFGLAVCACFTIFASFVMTLSLCATLGLMSPALRGREFFPYLVVLIGFENILITTKAVVGTPIDLPVKHRVAQGLAKEGWPMTKNLLCAFFCTALGFLTFDSAIQEFCLIAIISFTTDFFLQMFFFVPVLAIDIRRMELSDLRRHVPLSSIPPPHGNEKMVNTGFCYHSPVATRPRDTALPLEYHRRSMSPIPQNSQNFSGHRRVRSDASNAAFMSSERNASSARVSFQRRFWAFWTNRRVFQHFGMAMVLVWLMVFLCYTLLPSPSPPRPIDSVDLASSHLGGTRSGTGEPKTALPESKNASLRQLFGLRSINLHGFEVRWDTDNLWRYMAFSTWPAIAGRYNFSLAGRRLVIFEPIHVVQLFSPAEAMRARRSAYEATNADPATVSKSRSKTTEGFSEMVLPPGADDQECDSERTWWSHVLSFGHKEALRALDLPWNGFLDWTTRLWSTATMAAASLLGAGFFLTITAAVMLSVHKWLPRSNPNACREPVVRVRQLVVPLLKKNHSIEEWIVVHGCGEQFGNDTISLWSDGLFHGFPGTIFSPSSHRSRHRGETVDNLIAATVSGYFGGSALIRSIRLWSADCGHLVATIDRFYPGSFEIRGAGSRHRDLSRRFSPIWSMKVFAPTGSLVAGCANGTIEIWDLDNFSLRQVIDLTSPEGLYDAQGEVVETGGEPTPVGGVTVIEASLENQHIFYFGTSLGFVGCVKWALQPSPSKPASSSTELISRGSRVNRPQWSVQAKWNAHPRGRGVVHLTPQRVFLTRRCFTPRDVSAFDGHCLRSGGDGGHSSGSGSLREDWALISGAMDGSLALIQPCYFRFQRFQWDPTHILCADFLQSTIVVGQASGCVRMLSLSAAVPLANEDLRVEVSKLCTISATGAAATTTTTPTAEGSLGSASWIRLFKILTPSSTEDFRMVTYCHTGAVSVWSIHASNCHLIRRFPANTPAFAIRAPIICVDDRIIFGERGYLRLVNPRTAKYERSVQLMPPSLTSPTEPAMRGERTMDSRASRSEEQWERGLGPLGITGGSDGHQYLCGLSDAGKSLFIVPKSVLLN